MTILATRRARALAAVSALALCAALLSACTGEGEIALDAREARHGAPDATAQEGTQMAASGHGSHGSGKAPATPVLQVKMPLFTDLGSHTHKITTKNRDTQAYFDQGYRLLFNFNHNGAILSFKEALKRDPGCAMCWWGIAFAYGPNINMPMMPEAVQPAFEAVQNARRLAPNASPAEQAYIAAIVKRYTNAAKADRAAFDRAFAEAMADVAEDYPNDLDAQVLYAEALMDTSPWDYWQADRKTPKAGMEELIPTLEAVLKKNQRHPGAQHLYIHAVEATLNPGRAERYADMLRTAMPGAGHLVHMPSHIYNRIGRYGDAVRDNQDAAKSDEAYMAATNDIGMYAGMYYVHNLHFVWTAATSEGRSALAIDFGAKVVKATPPDFAKAAPQAEVFLPTKLYALLRFGKYNEVLREPKPDGKFALWTAMHHYAQARAYAATGDVDRAESELALISTSFPKGEAERFDQFGVPGQGMVDIAEHLAQAEIFRAQRRVKDEILELQEAVKLQDGLKYTEPPYWDFPVRQYLGAALLQAGRAKEAERVYRDDLREWPKNGWSLFGLAESLKRQGKAREARQVTKQFDLAWTRADVELKASRF